MCTDYRMKTCTPAACSIQLYTMIVMCTWNVTRETGMRVVPSPLLVCILIHSVFASDGKRRTLEGWNKRGAIESVSRKIFCWTCRPKVECTCGNKGKKFLSGYRWGWESVVDLKKGRCSLNLQRAGRLVFKKSLLDVWPWVKLYTEIRFVHTMKSITPTTPSVTCTN